MKLSELRQIVREELASTPPVNYRERARKSAHKSIEQAMWLVADAKGTVKKSDERMFRRLEELFKVLYALRDELGKPE